MNRITKRSVVLAVLLLAAFVLSISANAETGTTNIVAYVQIPVHVHSFTFSAEGNVLTAVCTNADNECDLPDGKVALTLNAPEDTAYDGKAKEATLSNVEKEAWTGAGLELPAIVYTAEQGSELTEGKAILPGSYTAGITMSDATASVSFKITGIVETPVASPAAGIYTGTQIVTLSTGTEGASIYYTTDGTIPTANSTKYTEPVTVDTSMTLKAIATKAHFTDSDVLEATYVITSQVIPVTKVEVFPDAMTMKPGESRKVTIRITPENATDKVLTVSMDQENIVTIAEDGTITALKDGTVTVTFTASNDVSDSCVITVKADPIQYKIIQGTNQTVFTNADQAIFASNADFSKFKCVKVDGAEVAKKYYTAESGSTVITFNRKFISNKLKVGTHSIEIVSTDGSAKANFTVAEPLPKTGDSSTPFLWLGMCTLAIFSILMLRKKAYRN